MKMLIALCVITLGVALWRFMLTPAHSASPASSASQPSSPDAVFLNLRTQALHMTRPALKLPPGPVSTAPFGVLMETGYDTGTATVVAFGDGNASLYTSTGGGFIGGAGHQVIRTAAQSMVTTAAQFQPQATQTTTFPLPQAGETRFYLLTDMGVFTVSALEQDLGEQRHPWAPLFSAGQDIITQYRRLQQGQ